MGVISTICHTFYFAARAAPIVFFLAHLGLRHLLPSRCHESRRCASNNHLLRSNDTSFDTLFLRYVPISYLYDLGFGNSNSRNDCLHHTDNRAAKMTPMVPITMITANERAAETIFCIKLSCVHPEAGLITRKTVANSKFTVYSNQASTSNRHGASPVSHPAKKTKAKTKPAAEAKQAAAKYHCPSLLTELGRYPTKASSSYHHAREGALVFMYTLSSACTICAKGPTSHVTGGSSSSHKRHTDRHINEVGQANPPVKAPTRRHDRSDDDQDGDDDQDRDDNKRNNNRINRHNKVDNHVRFACPFSKLDMHAHFRCYRKYELKRFSDVKQHISRCHLRKPLYCPTCCQEWERGEDNKWNAHTNSECRGPQHSYDSLTPTEWSELRELKLGGLSERDKWYRMWALLFVGHRRPESPYHDGNYTIEVVTSHLAPIPDRLTRNLPCILQQYRPSNMMSDAMLQSFVQAIHTIYSNGFDETGSPPRIYRITAPSPLSQNIGPRSQQLQPPQLQLPQLQPPQLQPPQFQFHVHQYQHLQFQDPQYQDPQFQNPQFQNPQFQDLQFQDLQFQDPQFQDPQFQDLQFQDLQFQDLQPQLEDISNSGMPQDQQIPLDQDDPNNLSHYLTSSWELERGMEPANHAEYLPSPPLRPPPAPGQPPQNL